MPFKDKLRNFLLHWHWDYPIGIGCEVLTQCNRRCYYCPQSIAPRGKQVISEETWQWFLYRLREFKWRGMVGLSNYSELGQLPNSVRYVREVAETGGIPYVFSNGDYIQQVAAWLEVKKCRVLVTEHPPFNENWKARIMALQHLYPRRLKVRRLGKEMHDHAGRMALPNIQPMTRCDQADGIGVLIDGNIDLCCADYDNEYSFGNVHFNSFHDIWYNATFVKARRLLHEGKGVTPLCQGCFKRKGWQEIGIIRHQATKP